jgi:hypothetical protein
VLPWGKEQERAEARERVEAPVTGSVPLREVPAWASGQQEDAVLLEEARGFCTWIRCHCRHHSHQLSYRIQEYHHSRVALSRPRAERSH